MSKKYVPRLKNGINELEQIFCQLTVNKYIIVPYWCIVLNRNCGFITTPLMPKNTTRSTSNVCTAGSLQRVHVGVRQDNRIALKAIRTLHVMKSTIKYFTINW